MLYHFPVQIRLVAEASKSKLLVDDTTSIFIVAEQLVGSSHELN